MEETLGKRIASHRKRLKLTQDQLAAQLGVTAQAVSKWENDLSCPDIGILPRLASIFGISTDALLGCEAPSKSIVHKAEILSDESEPNGLHIRNGQMEFHYDDSKKDALGLAVWVLLCGGVLLASQLLNLNLGFWDVLWTTGLFIFGLWGLYPKFSVFRLGCALFGGYFLLEKAAVTSFGLNGKLILPICLLLFGLSLLADAIKKPRSSKFHFRRNHHAKAATSSCNLEDDHFQCDANFGEKNFLISLPRLAKGNIDLSFGQLTVDLSGCEEIAENCTVEATCAFGEVVILVPKRFAVKTNPSSAFGAIHHQGYADPNPQGIILLDAEVSFGQIQVHYI